MFRQGVGGFKYYVGIESLAQVATREDRVCVLNIMGGESSEVTPVSHAFSGGNVAFGTSPGRRGQKLRTPAGDIPVFNNVRDGLDAGLRFNTGVIYLPPSGVRDGVAELVRVHQALDWEALLAQARALHCQRILGLGLYLANDLLGAELPAPVLGQVRADPATRALGRQVREQLREFHAALTVPGEGGLRRGDGRFVAVEESEPHVFGERFGELLAVHLLQFRLADEQFELRRAAVEEDENAVSGPRREMRRPRRQRIVRGGGFCSQPCQRQVTEAAGSLLQELPARLVSGE